MTRLRGSKLYKFFPLNSNTLKVIKNGSLWFQQPGRFNDPFDCAIDYIMDDSPETIKKLVDETAEGQGLSNLRKTFLVSPDKEELSRSLKEILSDPEKLKAHLDHLKKVVSAKLGVCCFTLNDESAMWAYYASDHKGICIEFDSEVLMSEKFLTEGNRAPTVAEVKYPKEPVIPNLCIDDDDEIGKKVIFQKPHYWAHEREVRVAFLHPDYDTGKRTSMSLPNKGFNVKLPKNSVNRVILGCRFYSTLEIGEKAGASPEQKEEAKFAKLILENINSFLMECGVRGAEQYRAHPCYKTFKLKYKSDGLFPGEE